MMQNGMDADEGLMFFIERAGHEIGWPSCEISHVLKDAAEAGVMTEEWLFELRGRIALAELKKENIQ